MKNVNVILSRTVLIGLMSLSIACADKKKDNTSDAENKHDQEMNHDHESHDMGKNSEMTVTESKTASALIDHYLAVKNALVNDDKDAAAKAAESFGTSVASFDINKVESSKQEEAKEILEEMKTHAEHISKMDIAHQRAHFAEINNDIKNLLAITGSDRMLYEQFCPMYADNEGGFWLSASKDIKNPLFGSQMLKCGAVKQTIVLK